MLNRVVLIGRLVRDPELRYTSSGVAVCNFTLAVERNYTNQQGERDVDFIKIVTWRKLAENCAHHLGKGRLVGVDGSLQIRNRKSEKDGRTYVNPEVVADNVRFLDWPSDDNNRQQEVPEEPPERKNANQKTAADDFDEDDFDVPF
ncbi:MAG: single-stranded DNA-binding protein [Halanaerobiaceae bacterium]